ncbi:glutathione S-transferase-like [Leptopilina heterotoma]|uniref:glutathione S-transferase-like n=1 Tax=Leptopilina heterotoma TaxID=63436 RepID=UPI001CA94AF8|nr:glutathione S-transferase-like [Leptopilina heterotoma]
MPNYKLTYFPVKALGEPIRFVMSYAKIEFEDDRFDRENWPKLKDQMPYGQVPVLEVDGKQMHQSNAICRYFAKQCGLAGKNDMEAYEIDAAVETIHDLRAKIAAYSYESHEEAKEQKLKTMKETVPYILKRMEEQVKKNGGHFVGGSLSMADLTFVALLDYLNYMAKYDIIEDYENLKKLKETVLAVPQIKEWVAKRPKTDL